jgi:hypothetical protein
MQLVYLQPAARPTRTVLTLTEYYTYIGATALTSKIGELGDNGDANFGEVLSAGESRGWAEHEIEDEDLYLC